jgi:hypothetical protein
MPPKKTGEKPWLKDWKSIAAAVAVVLSSWAGVRGEMAQADAEKAEVKAEKTAVAASENVDVTATAVMAVLNERIESLEKSEQEMRVYVASMDQRDKYWEKMLWDLYRGRHGATAADRVLSMAPAKPEPLPMVSREKKPVPKSAAAAKRQYQKACASGDPLCAD